MNDENPEVQDRVLKMAFEPIKSQPKRDLSKWVEIKEKRREAGRKGAEANTLWSPGYYVGTAGNVSAATIQKYINDHQQTSRL